MSEKSHHVRLGVGFRIKTAKTIAVAVTLSDDGTPTAIDRRSISLWDEAVPASAQPFHAGLESRLGKRDPVVTAACAAVHRTAAVAIPDYLELLARAVVARARGFGLVVNSLRDPSRIGNDHIRAHALEGRLFLDAVEAALGPAQTFHVIQGQCFDDASATLERSTAAVQEMVASVGKPLGPPWRADEKLACAAAWIAAAQ